MFNFDRKKYRFLTPVDRKKTESILDRPEFTYPDPKKDGKPEKSGSRLVNYLRKPRAEAGNTALLSSLTGVLLSAAAFRMMLLSLGNPPLSVSAVAVSAMLFSAYALFCGLLALREKGKDQLFSRIGIALGGIVLTTWIIMIFTGLTA